MMGRVSERSLEFLGDEWRAELGFDGLRLRSGSGQELRFPSSVVMDAHQVLESYRQSRDLGVVSPDTVPPDKLADWLRVHGAAYMLDYFFGVSQPAGTEGSER